MVEIDTEYVLRSQNQRTRCSQHRLILETYGLVKKEIARLKYTQFYKIKYLQKK